MWGCQKIRALGVGLTTRNVNKHMGWEKIKETPHEKDFDFQVTESHCIQGCTGELYQVDYHLTASTRYKSKMRQLIEFESGQIVSAQITGA